MNGNLLPTVDNVYELGSNSQRWSTVFAANGTIQTSDLRFKENVKPLAYGLSSVLALRPVMYNWQETEWGQRVKVGLIAQEVRTIIPEVVYDPNEGESDLPLGMNYGELVPVLIQAIQEQQEYVERLEYRIEELEKNQSQ